MANKRRVLIGWRAAVLIVVIVLAVIAAVIGSIKPSSSVPLKSLNNIDDLRARFNDDRGKVRLVLLLSPT